MAEMLGQERKQSASFDSSESAAPMGNVAKAPPFQLRADAPLQRRVIHLDPDLRNLTGSQLETPAVAERLRGLTDQELRDLMFVTTDQQVREFVNSIITRRTGMYAAIHGRGANVLPADRPMFEQLRAFVLSTLPRFQQVVSNPPRSHRHLRNNPFALDIIQRLQRLNGILAAESMMIRFDSTRLDGLVLASYAFTENTIYLRPFSDPGSLPSTLSSLLHEHAHSDQDAAVERRLAANSQPVSHSQEDELQQEIEGRRMNIYTDDLFAAIGVEIPGMNRSTFGRGAMDFLDQFEGTRSSNPDERASGNAMIRHTISTSYAAQIAANSPGMNIRGDITPNNFHVVIQLPGGPRDLGEAPQNLHGHYHLREAIDTMVKAQPDFGTWFQARQGSPGLALISIAVFFRGQHVLDVAFRPPAAPTTAPNPAPVAPTTVPPANNPFMNLHRNHLPPPM